MSLSPYFRNLRSAYQAELDDLAYDSEGLYVLPKRLQQRRGEMGFLVRMLELSPEMVAVVFHKGFRFNTLSAMDDLVSRDSEDLPAWSDLTDVVTLEPWAQSLLPLVLEQAQGDWFMGVAAGLEYLYQKPENKRSGADEEDQADEDDAQERGHNEDEDPEEREARARDEAGADWMVQQGFDRKD